jgi:hypothetical protein
MSRASVAVVIALFGCLSSATSQAQVAGGPSRRDLKAVLAAGLATALAAYVGGVIVARNEPHSIAAVDSLPVAGAIAGAARNPADRQGAPMLLVSAGLQMAGWLMVAGAATELHEATLRRWNVDVGASANGCGAALSWRFH